MKRSDYEEDEPNPIAGMLTAIVFTVGGLFLALCLVGYLLKV